MATAHWNLLRSWPSGPGHICRTFPVKRTLHADGVRGALIERDRLLAILSFVNPPQVLVFGFVLSTALPGYQVGNQVAVSKFGGATFGNIVLGGGAGAIVDAASGANYYYDSPITVPLGEPKSATQAPTPNPAKPAV